MAEGSQRVSLPAQLTVVGPLMLAVAAMLATRLGAPHATSYDIAWTAAGVAALAGTLLARGHAHEASHARWNLWALAAGSWLFGQVAWDVYAVAGAPPSPNLADAGWWGFAVLIMLSMVRIPGGSSWMRALATIEAVPLIIAASALTLAELWLPAANSSLALAPKLAAVAYPPLYIAAVVLTLQAAIGGVSGVLDTRGVQLVLGGFVVEGVAFILWSIQLLGNDYVPGNSLLDPLWVAGLALVALGSLQCARKPEPVVVVEEPSYRSGILPVGMFLILPFTLLQPRVINTPIGIRLGIVGGLAFCGAALVTRSGFMGRRLRGLLTRERDAMAGLAERESELARLNRQLAHLNRQLIHDSRQDPLTGVSNRRALSGDLEVLDRSQRQQHEAVAVALCDADCFKAYNDRFGHLAGDQALRMIASTIREVLRGGDAAYRYGGEELLLVLRNVSDEEAVTVAERVRAAVEHAGYPHPDSGAGVLTVSIGVASGQEESGPLIARADAALYEAKRQGRNRVVAASEGTVLPGVSRPRPGDSEEPVPRHLRSMLAVSRAAAAGRGPMPVLDALAETICNELSFGVVAVNLLDEDREELRVVIVKGDPDARETLLGTSSLWSDWEHLLEVHDEGNGAIWLPAGTYQADALGPTWTPPAAPSGAPEDWHPEDMLFLPLRGASGEILGVVSVDQPVLGRRPTGDELTVLMAVADHAGLALEQVMHEAAPAEQREPRLAAMLLLAEALDMRDPSTARHSYTVGRYARATAIALGLAPGRVDRIHAAGVLHDLGKVGIGDAILHKPGPLTEAEWVEMKRHPGIGAQILRHAGMADIAAWVGAHHERLDGRGYPAGLTEPEISLEARILAVADAYEAMIADRCYRPAMSEEEARAELVRCTGTQFDPHVVDAFLKAISALPIASAALPAAA
ncbi:MAG TPA: diguanylate cyclase [Solirubrobacteraceae bacterium]|nr:diguanylate cyclase [Solirubrobacteraceae bacterium]